MSHRLFLSLFFCISALSIQSQIRLKPYDEYINQYAGIAIEQQKHYGIPASITLAQGLLESGAGKSQMAIESNNHFGIKCHSDWKGETASFFDDGEMSCFRKYNKVEDSYDDHSQFLVQGRRYASLFKLDITDYRGWAEGLQKAGYATDRSYADKLIRIIETYDLNEYTKGKTVKRTKEKKVNKKEEEKKAAREAKLAARKAKTRKGRKVQLNNDALKNAKDYQAIESTPSKESINPLSTHDIMYMGTTPYIIAQYGDSFTGIAEEFGISARRLHTINEFDGNYVLTPGEPVYLDNKTNWWEGDYPLHTVQEGDSMHSIAQKYGLQLKALYKLNDMKVGDPIKIGQKIKLRNPEQMSNIIKAMNEAINKKDSIK
jgi:LysM repeat protein